MKKIISFLFCALLVAGSLSLAGCHTPDDEIDSLSLDRAFSPLNFKLSLEANVNATFTWTPLATSNEFYLTLLKADDNKVYKEVKLIYYGDTPTMSYKFNDLPGNVKFIARLRGVSKNPSSADSKPVEIPFETGLEQLFLNDGVVADEDVTATTAVMRWIAASNVTHLEVDNDFGTVQLDAKAKADGVYKLTGLTMGKTYVVKLCRDDAVRGTCTFVASDKIDAYVTDKSASSLTIKWDAAFTVTSLKLSAEGEPDVDVTLTPAQQAAHTYAFASLKAKTAYTITIFNQGVESGKLFATTLGVATAWDFTTWTLKTYAENTVEQELTLMAAAGKEMYISADADYGVNFLDLKGKSTIKAGEAPTQRAVKFSVSGEGVIVIDCYANGTGRNFFAFVDALGANTAAVEAPASFQNRGKIYIPCQGFTTPSTIWVWTDNTINHVYSIKWYDGKEAPGQTAQPLATPTVTATPASVTVGDATAVKFAWNAVANAVSYDWIIKLTKADGTAQTLRGTTNATETTLAADVVKDLKATDPFVMYVIAKPEGEFQFRPSAPGSASLTVSDTKLAKPVVTLNPAKVDKGTSTAVVASWPAVANAASYDVSFNGGAAVNIATTSHTIAAATVAALVEGTYTVSVVAKPAGADKQASDAGTATLTVEKPGGVTPLAYEWDFTNASVFVAGDLVDNTVYGDLTILATSAAKVTIEGGKRIKLNGKSTLDADGVTPTARAFKFKVNTNGKLTVSCASSSASDLTRELWITVGASSSLIGVGPAAQTDLTYDVTGVSGDTDVYLFCKVNALNFYSVKWEPVQ